MSSDPKKPPFDAPPGETPDLLQQDVSLDRRRRVPTFEELQHSGGESTTDPVRPAVPAPPKQTGIPMGTVPARPSSLDTGLNPQRVPPGMTPRQAPLSIEPTTDPVRPALARPATTHPVPTVPPPAPGARPPPAPPPPPRSSASAAGLPQVPRTPSGTAIPQVAGGAQAPGMRTPAPAPGGAPRSAPSASGTPQVPG
ncbi:MAG: hypothetical protein JNM17_14560, partial [Archangium sp.]|nr:hypothetical protein [Archangium sp.]